MRPNEKGNCGMSIPRNTVPEQDEEIRAEMVCDLNADTIAVYEEMGDE